MAVDISLYGDDAEQFREIKSRIEEARGGNEPTNAEVVRLLMQEAGSDRVPGGWPR